METITFIYKDKVEQFKEQFPTLYAEIYQLGYINGINDTMRSEESDENVYPDYQDNYEDPEPDYDNYYAEPTDDSERFCLYDNWDIIYKKAQDLEFEGYKAGNTDWPKFMVCYKDRDKMHIAWNPTHKQFAVESDIGTINEIYPNLVNAKDLFALHY